MTHKMLSRSPTYQFNNDIYALNMYQYPCSVPGFAVCQDWNEYVSNTQYCRAYNYYPNWYHQKKMSCPKKRKRSFTIREILGLDNDEPENNTDCFPSENLLPPRLTPEPVQVSSIRCFENEEFPHRVETVSSSDSYISSDSSSYRLSPPCLEPQSSNDCRSFEDVLSPSKRSKRIRTTFTPQQLEKLELEFKRTQYMVGSARIQLALELNLTEAQVKVWFQNRRIKLRKQSHEMQQAKLEKLKATESEEKECESDSNFSNQISSSSSSRDDSQRSV